MYKERITGYAKREKGNGIMTPCSTHQKRVVVVVMQCSVVTKGGKRVLYNRVVMCSV